MKHARREKPRAVNRLTDGGKLIGREREQSVRSSSSHVGQGTVWRTAVE
jgi:hypothetical protein